jgi:hypothetical protein
MVPSTILYCYKTKKFANKINNEVHKRLKYVYLCERKKFGEDKNLRFNIQKPTPSIEPTFKLFSNHETRNHIYNR